MSIKNAVSKKNIPKWWENGTIIKDTEKWMGSSTASPLLKF